MTIWSLKRLLSELHDDIEQRLGRIRRSLAHPDAKGDGSENVWLELFKKYLPQRYRAAKAFIVDSKDAFSQQIDVVVFDRQYSPLIFEYEGQTIIPAESVYAVFEAKQAVDAGMVAYAQKKAASVRRLHRTSLPIPHAGGTFDPKPLIPIYGGVLAFDSNWNPAMGESMLKALKQGGADARLDIGCVAAHGYFVWNSVNDNYDVTTGEKAATRFLFKLISELQGRATVPMIDVEAYARWLCK